MDWQRIHVSAQPDRSCTVANLEHTDDICLRRSAMNFDPEFVQFCGNEV
jgi:hypothetical protein